jgi:predicted transcriptional regulator
LSIKPEYSSAIFQGRKRYEFRRNNFARHVDVVVVYATAPVQKVVGEFDVRSIINESVSSLWEHTKQFSGVERDFFFRYFQGRERGFAIEVGEVRLYHSSYCPVEHLGVRPPQSFVYLDSALNLEPSRLGS